jgi:2'-5' RNA ligase
MRVFTAVELPDPIREALDDRVARLLGSIRGVRTVARDNLHVTLRFIGNVPPARITYVLSALQRATARVRSATVGVRGLSAFPDAPRARVLWAGIKDPHGVLAALEREQCAGIEPLGYTRDDRPFTAHVTLGRVRKGTPPDPRLVERLAAVEESEAFGAFPVERVTVYESQLGRGPGGGPLYAPLARFPLRPRNTQS